MKTDENVRECVAMCPTLCSTIPIISSIFEYFCQIKGGTIIDINCHNTLPEKCPYSELFWSTFSRIQTEYGEILSISPYSVVMRENADQNNSEYGHILSSDGLFGWHWLYWQYIDLTQ